MSGKRIRDGAKQGLVSSAVSISSLGAGDGWRGGGAADGTGLAEQSLYRTECGSPQLGHIFMTLLSLCLYSFLYTSRE